MKHLAVGLNLNDGGKVVEREPPESRSDLALEMAFNVTLPSDYIKLLM
jgi:hypothetical protein